MQKLRICIAEDSKVVRAAIQSLLTNSGYFELVGAAQDGREALDICKDSKPQVVLLDVSMPGMDGIEAARQITAICPDSVVIMLSSQDDMDVIREALKAGARDFIRKPVHGPELIQKILSIYAREGSRRSGTADTGRRKIITLTSPKTGVGTTTIAINTAVCMVKKFRKRVLAIDLDFNYADTSHCLGRKTQPSIGELLGQTDPQRLENIRKYIIETASGVHLLPGPASPMPQISRESAVETIIRAVEPDFDFVFVDLVPSPTDVWVRCLES
ncbi:MAG: response regulator [Candidatus Riflebacteria bacterium]|nr:response regulator [Candidatus Riflebacteria bacterium]